MATHVIMPKLGLSMKTGTVNKWLKAEGDTVKKGEPIVEVMTEKITNKVEAKADGTLLKIAAPKGSVVPVAGLIGVIGEPGEDISDIFTAAASTASVEKPTAQKGGSGDQVSVTSGARVNISPAARRLAEENGIDPAQIVGTGPAGRITKEDVEQAIDQGVGCADDRPTIEVIPYEGMRRAIGENMAASWTTNAKVTHHVQVDLSKMIAFRKLVNEGLQEKEKISVTALLTKVVARALELNPCVNASLSGDKVFVWQDINIGMAVAVSGGLVVPVLRNANTKSLTEVNRELGDLARRARKNKLTADEMSGATFTITNVGAYGSVDFFTPIINPPEVAILGVGRTVERPIAEAGQVIIRPMIGLSLSFDHRVVDGAPAAEWLSVLIDLMANPAKVFI